MRKSFSAFLLSLAMCALTPSGQVHAAKVVALVVGINQYDGVTPLFKAVNDATAVAKVLTDDLKVPAKDVKLLLDANRKSFVAAWREALEKVEKDTVLLVFYAGHGVELRGHNYLVPKDAVFDDLNQASLREVAIGVQTLLAELAEKQKSTDAVGIFILDACRENPFDKSAPVGSPQQAQAKAELNPVGLAPPLENLPRNIFMMYSAGIGQKAIDGGSENSVFTTELLPLLKKSDPRLALADLAQALRSGVHHAALQFEVDGQPHYQTPAYYDQLLDRLSLFGEKVDATKLVTSVATSSALASRMRSLRAGDGLLECNECPEVVLVPPPAGQKRYAIGKFEVTRREWKACIDDGGGCAPLRAAVGTRPQDRDPVTEITVGEIQTYLRWLSGKTKQTYRLPTALEWEHAARAGATGASVPLKAGETLCTYANAADKSLGSVVWSNMSCDDKVGRQVTIVGRYRANAWGLHDTLGNAWELTSDCSDGRQPTAGQSCKRNIAKGGSWRTGRDGLRFDSRNEIPAGHRRSTVGFRLVREFAD